MAYSVWLAETETKNKINAGLVGGTVTRILWTGNNDLCLGDNKLFLRVLRPYLLFAFSYIRLPICFPVHLLHEIQLMNIITVI